jgi:hypothetical protein
MSRFFFMISEEDSSIRLKYFNVANILKAGLYEGCIMITDAADKLHQFSTKTPCPRFDGIFGSNFMSACLETIGKLEGSDGKCDNNLTAFRWLTKDWIKDDDVAINPAYVVSLEPNYQTKKTLVELRNGGSITLDTIDFSTCML